MYFSALSGRFRLVLGSTTDKLLTTTDGVLIHNRLHGFDFQVRIAPGCFFVPLRVSHHFLYKEGINARLSQHADKGVAAFMRDEIADANLFQGGVIIYFPVSFGRES